MNSQTLNARRIIVGVGDMKLSDRPGDILVTHALGSCIGITVYDPVASVGGLLHFMLPDSSVNLLRAQENPWMFADVAIPLFLEKVYGLGATKSHLIVKVAGGAQFLDDRSFFAIGKRNHTMMRRMLWKNGVLIKAEQVGGTMSRTLYLDVASGRVWFTSGSEEFEL